MAGFLGETEVAEAIEIATADPRRYVGSTSEIGDALVAAVTR